MLLVEPIAPGDRQSQRKQVDMTTTHRMTATAAVIVSLAAAGAPTAIAGPVGVDTATAANQAPAAVYSRPDKSLIPVTTPYGARIPQSSAQQPIVRIQTPQSGFDWEDAGIGAAGGVAIAMLGLGGALVVSNRRPRRTRQTTALPS
jgi:hypothetical protein